MEHQLGNPNSSSVQHGFVQGGEYRRYCRHPVPIAGKKDLYSFCMCYINGGDYARAGNYAMINVDLPNTKEDERQARAK